MDLKKHTRTLERAAYAAAIIVLLFLLIPAIRGERGTLEELARVEPPLAMKVYSTGYASIDSLLNEGIRSFGKHEYSEASRLLSKAHFYLSVKLKEGKIRNYPDYMLLYLGLAQFYRGDSEDAEKILMRGKKESPSDERYPWYLAHIYIDQGKVGAAREELERVIELKGEFEGLARSKLKKLARFRK